MATYAVLRELAEDPDGLDVKLGLVDEEDEAALDDIDDLENQRRRRLLLGSGDVTVA